MGDADPAEPLAEGDDDFVPFYSLKEPDGEIDRDAEEPSYPEEELVEFAPGPRTQRGSLGDSAPPIRRLHGPRIAVTGLLVLAIAMVIGGAALILGGSEQSTETARRSGASIRSGGDRTGKPKELTDRHGPSPVTTGSRRDQPPGKPRPHQVDPERAKTRGKAAAHAAAPASAPTPANPVSPPVAISPPAADSHPASAPDPPNNSSQEGSNPPQEEAGPEAPSEPSPQTVRDVFGPGF